VFESPQGYWRTPEPLTGNWAICECFELKGSTQTKMLKPSKKLTKREMRRDPLLETIDKTRDYIEENRQQILYVAGALAVVLVLAWGWTNSRATAKAEANLANTRVTSAYVLGVNTDVIAELENIVAEYGDNAQTAQSKFYLAQARLDSADEAGARQLYNELLKQNHAPSLKVGAALKLAGIEEQSGNYAAAADWYVRAADMATPSASQAIEIQAAYAFYQAGETNRASDLAADLMDSDIQGTRKEHVEYLQGLIKGK